MSLGLGIDLRDSVFMGQSLVSGRVDVLDMKRAGLRHKGMKYKRQTYGLPFARRIAVSPPVKLDDTEHETEQGAERIAWCPATLG
jgi:hypothetical protein